ncbi:DUF2334 domain-containing protein [Clostridium sp. C2-6-12]|uniref:DUF2334 domain-containing protein n=1 Tax=Clostridium sp. C2-6-12 TaxID=2698832 RepID=UPI00136E1A8A|nr:DUF2334 domain-containing protein [Clostridium sp. C2-6-12]
MINRKFIYLMLFIFIFIGCTSKKVNVKNNLEQKESANILQVNYNNFNGLNMIEDKIKLKIDGKSLELKLPIYLNKNRYYICLNELSDKLNGTIKKSDDLLKLKIKNKDYSIDLSSNMINCPTKSFYLKKTLLNEGNIYYIGFSDLSNMLNLYTRWDKSNKIIHCSTNGFNNLDVNPYKSKISQIGLLRLEDVGLNSEPYCNNYFEKLRIISDYLSKRKIPYHIAWIPRYIIPNLKMDNDPLVKNNFQIAEMVYSLDFFSINGGVIGLHGYTHQLGNSESGLGFEFGRYEPSTTIFREKIVKAIETADFLDVPINFFEVPHYEITSKQNKIAEEYFKILYYPFNDFGLNKADLTKPQLSPYNHSSYYISTPLNYIPGGKEDISLAKLKKANINNMGSVFYHPYLEDSYISLTEDTNGIPAFIYKDNSTLKKLINILEEKGFKMIKITDI